MKSFFATLAVSSLLAVVSLGHASADSTLDRVIASKKLRCGAMLDNPPSGFRNQQGKPDGFDVAYCKDMAKVLGAEAEIVETPSPDRIPALVSKRIDVLIAGTTATAQRGLSVAFTQPYVNYTTIVVTRKGANIKSYADLKRAKLGGVTGTTTEQLLNSEIDKGWKSSGAAYYSFANDTDAYMALQQGKVDAILQSAVVYNALHQSGQFPEFESAGLAPLNDLAAIAVLRDDQLFLNWAKLFVFQQVSSGRFAELYKQYFGNGEIPPLTASGVSY
ncbi:transporter substrate-binding domain-containing protein [Bradyrhizobium sp. 187]|uniref:transporter substrate-binding domain-containing protein n=1 Tax=Bradyrhizobium sp. 187 TaxID=2782655 RepID=UPI001FFFABCE|nr:transporter substrate-binding domain-containing protein [Bradyrhizobium sp. 187]UPJ76801.1 transporter substrate-binding domain-containing protein [Bradyrhizobium sp. 187]